MSQFGGGAKVPPPWQQQRPAQAAPQLGSLLGQPPQPPQIVQQPQYAPVQQSMIQPPGLGGLQSLGQPNLGAASMAQPTMGAGQASNVSMAAASIMGQPPVSSAAMQPPSMVNPTQLVNTVAPMQQQIQQQVSSVAYPAPRTMAQVTTVSYPTPRALAPQGFNPAATPSNLNPALAAPGIPNVNNANIPGNNSSSGQQPQKQRVFTGTITKLCADFGFVDEDVFFQTSCVKGPKPSVNDRVLVEASYNPNMPFKWNANRVQVIPGPQSAPSANPPRTAPSRGEPQGRSGSYNAVPPPNFSNDAGGGAAGPRGSAGTTRSRSPRRDRRDRDRSRERERPRNDKDREEKRETRKRSRSRSRGRSPPRRRPRVLPRYNVQVPKIMLHMKEANVPELRKRYSNLYVPSDVFLARPLWSNTFQAHRPFHFPQPVSFHIMNKEVDPVLENDAIYDAPDANHNFAAKVMLMAVPAIQDIYRRACALSEDPSDVRDCFVHPTRLINFLVGLKGKNETMAIGGYWSPSLDGPNPEKDPQVLINTAIRCTRALTGIDLAPCTTWYRFAEIYYRRGGSSSSSRSTNSSGSSSSSGSGSTARVETTVLFLPDVWNVCPTKLEWDGLHLNYKRQLDKRLLVAGGGDPAAATPDHASANTSANNLQISQPEQDEEDWEEEALKKRDPTNWAELDPKTMKVVELRGELDARLMNSKGLKSQLIARLTKVLKTEQEKEEAEALANAELMKKDENRMKEEEDKKREEEKKRREEDEKKKDEEEKRKAEERERTILEKRYTLPEQPMIVVHPSRIAKSGKFDCTTMSLSVLLDYRQEDNKEHSFEVSLFAELFNEMLMRDFAFRIYRSLVEAPEKKEEKKEKEKEKDTKKDDKDKKKDDKDKDEKEKERDRDKDKDKDKDKEKEKEKDERKDRSKDDKEKDETSKKDKDDKDKIEKIDDKEKKDEKDEKKSKEDSDDKKIKDEEKKEEEDEEEEMEEEDDDEVDDEDSKDTRISRGSKDKDKDRKRSSDDKKDRREKKEKKKMVTIDPFLLLAFVYFDQTHTGYIIDRDLEDIINMLGLNLSRASQKKIMTKVISRDVLYYRKMTDVEEKERDKPRESIPVTDLESLAMGNNGLLPSFLDQVLDAASKDKSSNKKDKTGVKDEVAVSSATTISYEGSIISIGKLMQQLERSQKARTDTEDKLRQLQKELEQSKEEAKNSTEKSQKLSREVRSANSNIKTLEEELQKVSEDNSVYQRALNGVRDVIKPLVTDLDVMDDTDVEMKSIAPVGTTEVKIETDDKPLENGTSQTK